MPLRDVISIFTAETTDPLQSNLKRLLLLFLRDFPDMIVISVSQTPEWFNDGQKKALEGVIFKNMLRNN